MGEDFLLAKVHGLGSTIRSPEKCYTCEYNCDHPGNQCTFANGQYHMPNIKRDKAHLYAHQGASMVAQHKSLANGEGCGMGWIMANAVSKAQFVMIRQQQFRQQYGN